MEEGHQLRQVRIEKLHQLRELGIEPYPYAFEANAKSSELISGYRDRDDPENGRQSRIAGRIRSFRGKGKVAFAHLDDGHGLLQLYLRKEEVGEEPYRVVKLLDLGDLVGVEGYMFRTRTGEVTLYVKSLVLLAKSLRPMPVVKEKVVDGEKVTFDEVRDKELRYRQRYVDLVVNPEVKEVFRIRAAVIDRIRRFLNDREYLEVDTPVLQPIYGGAAARPFTTDHNALDRKLYLRISNELYLKRLIVGGLNRVYEFSKDFRNEGIDRTHNPEFTMLEFYQAYADYHEMMDLVEDMLVDAAATPGVKLESNELYWRGLNINLKKPWPRRSMLELIEEKVGGEIALPLDKKQLAALCKKHGIEIKPGMSAGKLLDELFGELVEPDLINPTFVTDYPLETSPLAKRHRSKPGLTERFELIIGGMEIANAFSELNDPLDQRERFEAHMRLRDEGDEEAQVLDEDYLRALEYGLPPTGGVGIGIDRLVMLFTGMDTIKDVILFPQLRAEE
ncbi:MAG: lysine--tRNA ligase [Candidatus Glassbacteria bacterium]|nr:lysine--tRNA ligase [Candidatus Glassbacteria bacterium]